MTRSQILLTTGMVPLLVVPVWAAGGTFKPWQGPFLWLCAFAWLCWILPGSQEKLGTRRQRLSRLFRDPSFWLSAGFLVFLGIQTLNSGRVGAPDFDTGGWTYSPPPLPGLPWAFTRSESYEMLQWFTPALTLFLLLRHAGQAVSPRVLCLWVGLNGFLNALLAFVHRGMGWENMYGIQKLGKDVYGSFGYPNHGAVFFILLFALALGLLLRELITEASDRDPGTLGFATVWVVVFFLAANLSTSRAGILGSWLVMGLGLLTVALIAWPRIHPAQRLYGVLFFGLIGFGLLGAFWLFAEPIHLQELQNATRDLNLYQEWNARLFQIKGAWLIWLDHPVYGVGGWGYRYLAWMHTPRELWSELNKLGKANVHNDFLQFLCEFGLLGMTLLLGAFLPTFLSLLRGAKRKVHHPESLWANPLRICVFWGLAILILDAQLDIPFRSPAVLIHAIFLLYLFHPHEDDVMVWSPKVDWKRLLPPLVSMQNRIWGVEPEGASPEKIRRKPES